MSRRWNGDQDVIVLDDDDDDDNEDAIIYSTTSSNSNQDEDLNDDEFDQVKERFRALLPKYGTLWRSMTTKSTTAKTTTTPTAQASIGSDDDKENNNKNYYWSPSDCRMREKGDDDNSHSDESSSASDENLLACSSDEEEVENGHDAAANDEEGAACACCLHQPVTLEGGEVASSSSSSGSTCNVVDDNDASLADQLQQTSIHLEPTQWPPSAPRASSAASFNAPTFFVPPPSNAGILLCWQPKAHPPPQSTSSSTIQQQEDEQISDHAAASAAVDDDDADEEAVDVPESPPPMKLVEILAMEDQVFVSPYNDKDDEDADGDDDGSWMDEEEEDTEHDVGLWDDDEEAAKESQVQGGLSAPMERNSKPSAEKEMEEEDEYIEESQPDGHTMAPPRLESNGNLLSEEEEEVDDHQTSPPLESTSVKNVAEESYTRRETYCQDGYEGEMESEEEEEAKSSGSSSSEDDDDDNCSSVAPTVVAAHRTPKNPAKMNATHDSKNDTSRLAFQQPNETIHSAATAPANAKSTPGESSSSISSSSSAGVSTSFFQEIPFTPADEAMIKARQQRALADIVQENDGFHHQHSGKSTPEIQQQGNEDGEVAIDDDDGQDQHRPNESSKIQISQDIQLSSSSPATNFVNSDNEQNNGRRPGANRHLRFSTGSGASCVDENQDNEFLKENALSNHDSRTKASDDGENEKQINDFVDLAGSTDAEAEDMSQSSPGKSSPTPLGRRPPTSNMRSSKCITFATSSSDSGSSTDENEWSDTGGMDDDDSSEKASQPIQQTKNSFIVDSDEDDESNGEQMYASSEVRKPRKIATPASKKQRYDSSEKMSELIQRTKNVFIIDSSSDGDDDSLGEKIFGPSVTPAKTSKVEAPSSKKKPVMRNRELMAQDTFRSFDKRVFQGRLGAGTSLTWSNKLRTTAGVTRLTKKADGSKTAFIVLSTKVCDDSSRINSTLMHEMCHAAVFLLDGAPKEGPHGPSFKKWGQHAMRCVPNVVVTTTHDYNIKYKYAWTCTNKTCGVLFQRHSRSIDVAKQVCGKCKSPLMEIEVPGPGDTSRTPRKQRAKAPPSAYNLFVQDQSASVRQRLQQQAQSGSKVTQSQVMKECARLWQEQKGATTR